MLKNCGLFENGVFYPGQSSDGKIYKNFNKLVFYLSIFDNLVCCRLVFMPFFDMYRLLSLYNLLYVNYYYFYVNAG